MQITSKTAIIVTIAVIGTATMIGIVERKLLVIFDVVVACVDSVVNFVVSGSKLTSE